MVEGMEAVQTMAASIHHDMWQFISTVRTVRHSTTQWYCKWFTPCCITQTLPKKHSLLSKCHTVLQYMYQSFHLCADFYLPWNRSTALCACFHTKFHPNLTTNVWRTDKNSFISLSKAWLSMNRCAKVKKSFNGITLVPILTKIMLVWQLFVMSSYTKFHEMWQTVQSVIPGHRWKWVWPPPKVFSLLCKECLMKTNTTSHMLQDMRIEVWNTSRIIHISSSLGNQTNSQQTQRKQTSRK